MSNATSGDRRQDFNHQAWFVSTDPSLLQADLMYGWLSATYWSPGIRREIVVNAIQNSIVVGAYAADGRQIGMARVVTDQATFAWLCDVFVVESERGRGIGRAMVKELMADPRLQTLRRWCLATRDAQEFYRPLGFSFVDGACWMNHMPSPACWKEQA